MTREELEKDLEDLRRQREQMVANVHALSGAIQYIQSKLAQLSTQTQKQD
jgi:prefoldin subunit 5